MKTSNDELMKKIELLVQDLKDNWGEDLVSVVVFGSRIKGMYKEESDIDIFIISNNLPVNRLQRLDLLLPILKNYPELMYYGSFILQTQKVSETIKPFYLGMLDGYKIIYDKDNWFKNLMEKVKKRLLELGSYKKRDPQGNEYWVLVPNYKWGMEIII